MKLSEAEELLPWCVAGTLSEEEARLVQAFIDSGDIPQEKVEALRQLADGVEAQVDNEPAYNPAILQRVMTQLDDIVQEKGETEKVLQNSTSKITVKPNLFERIATFMQWSLTPSWAKMTMAVQFSLLVAAVVAFSVSNKGSPTDGGFVTASGDTSGDLTVAFSPNASEADIRALLQQYHANIVAGPTALGMYTIDLADDTDIAATQAALQANAITTLVQPVQK